MAKLEPQQLRDLVAAGHVDTVVTVFPDMVGRFLGKRITGEFFVEQVLDAGMHACDYLLACDMEMDPVPGYGFASWEKGYGDFHAIVDPGTLRLLPWLTKTALAICDLAQTQDHTPVAVAPRQILKKQVERAAAAGFLPMMGSELEFYAFVDSYEQAKKKHFHDLEPYGWYIEDYHILQGTKEEWFIRAIRNAMQGAAVPVEFSKGEWGPGQHEINLRFASCLEMADRHTLYKNGVKEMAAQREISITFMAKWHEKCAGSSCHIHSSLWNSDGTKSLFADADAPLQHSRIFRCWLAGQLAHARELTLFYAPFVNSYKRYQAGSFAPTKIAWSQDNRTVGFRVLGAGDGLRVENRIPGADANPYLAFAATVAAGLDGIDRQLEPTDAFAGNAYSAAELPEVPMSLDEAIAALDESRFARDALGDEVVEHYLHAGRTELRKSSEVVTCWERQRCFERG